MPDSTPRDAVGTIRSQGRRVRWRRNLLELQRALYLVIAPAAAGAAAVVLLALRALLFGGRLVPPPEIAVTESGRRPERLTRVDARLGSRREMVPALGDAEERDEPTPALTRETRALQERIRSRLWGRTWQTGAE